MAHALRAGRGADVFRARGHLLLYGGGARAVYCYALLQEVTHTSPLGHWTMTNTDSEGRGGRYLSIRMWRRFAHEGGEEDSLGVICQASQEGFGAEVFDFLKKMAAVGLTRRIIVCVL